MNAGETCVSLGLSNKQRSEKKNLLVVALSVWIGQTVDDPVRTRADMLRDRKRLQSLLGSPERKKKNNRKMLSLVDIDGFSPRFCYALFLRWFYPQSKDVG